MGSNYYLVAQLPSLIYGLPPPMGSGQFRDLCSTLLSEGDAALLKECVLDPSGPPEEREDGQDAEGGSAYAVLPAPTSSALIDGWRLWERALRLNLAKLRSQKGKREAPALAFAEAPADPLDAAAAARAAMALESPLEAELHLDKARWDTLEALCGFDYFGRDTVYAYLLKLLLLERRALFKAEEGFTEYKALYASIMEAAPTSIESGEPK